MVYSISVTNYNSNEVVDESNIFHICHTHCNTTHYSYNLKIAYMQDSITYIYKRISGICFICCIGNLYLYMDC